MAYKSAETKNEARKMAKAMFSAKNNGEWVEKGCSKCKKGMLKRIYDYQVESRGKTNTICSTCDKKERFKQLKNNL